MTGGDTSLTVAPRSDAILGSLAALVSTTLETLLEGDDCGTDDVEMTKKANQGRRDVLVTGLNALGLNTPKPKALFTC